MAHERPHLRSTQIITNKHLFYALFVFLIIAFSQILIAPEPYNLIPFGLIAGTVFIAATFLYPMIGLFLYLLFYLIRPQELFPYISVMSYPYEKFIAIFIAVSIVINYLIRGRKFELFDIDIGILLFLAAAFLSVFPAIWVSGAKDTYIIFVKSTAVYFFLTRIVNTQKKFNVVIWFYALSVGFIAVSSTINYYMGNYEVAMHIERAAGLGGEKGAHSDPNSMAASLVLGFPFIFYLMKSHKGTFLKFFLTAVMAIILWTIIISGSRGGMLGAIIMLGLIAFHSRHRALSLVIAVITIAVLGAAMPEQYVERFSSIVHYNNLEDGTGAADSAQGRIRGFLVGMEILLTRPVTGVGIGCFSTYNHEYHGSWLQAHNLIGQLAGELGLLGIFTFAFFIYKVTKNIKFIREYLSLKKRKDALNYQIATACKISYIMLFILGMFGHNLYRFNWYLFAAFTAITARLVISQKGEDDRADTTPSPTPVKSSIG